MKSFLVLLSFVVVGFANAQTDTTSSNDYFLTFVKKVYLNPTVYLRTTDFKERTNIGFVALPDLSSTQNNASSGFEKGLQKLLRLLMQTDGGIRFYFNPDNATAPFTFWCTDNLWCKFKQPEKDSIQYYLNNAFSDSNLDLNNNQRFESTIDNTLDYIERVLAANPGECGDQPQNETTTINTKPLAINVHNTQGSKYDIDYKNYERLASNYATAFDEFTQQEWFAPSKMFVTGGGAEPLTMSIDLHDPQFKKENLKIEILKTHQVLAHTFSNDSVRFSLPENLSPSDPMEIIVKYKSQVDSVNYTVGLFMVNVVELQTKTVVILNTTNVPVGSTTLTAIQHELDLIYNPVGVKFNLETEAVLFPSDFAEVIQIENSGLFSTYMPDMREYVNEVYDLSSYDSDNYYLIIGLEASDPNMNGYMPRSKNVGFIFSSDLPNIIAHELGHGVFHLRHIFDEEELGLNYKGSTNDLMDYKVENSTNHLKDLYLHQWNFIQDPAFVSLFDEDENSNSVNIGLTADIFNKFKNTDGTLTLLSPAGKPITIPKETSEVRFSLPDDKWVYSFADGTIEAESSYTPVGSLLAFTVNGVFYYAQTSNGAFSGYKYRTSEQVEKPYKEAKSKQLENFIPIIAVPIFDQEGFKISICQVKYNKSHYASAIPDSNQANGNLDDFYKLFSYTTKELIKDGYITNITHITTTKFTNETIDFLKELLTTPSPGEMTSAFPVVVGNIFENLGFYCAGLDATTLYIAAMNYQQLTSYGECLQGLNQVISQQTFQQVVYAHDAEQNKGFYERLENDPIIKYSDRLKPKLPDISQRVQFFDQSVYSDYVNQRLKMMFLSLRKFNSFAQKFIADADGVEETIVENDIAVLIEMYDIVDEQQGESVADCLLQMLSANTKLEILKKHEEWTLLDDKEEMVTKVLALASAEDFELIYPELMKDNYALLQSLEGDLWASEYDLFCNSLAVQFYYHHVYNNTLDIDNLPVFPLYKENYAPGIFDQYSEGEFDDDGVDLYSYIFGLGNDREQEDKSPDKMYRFVLMEDFSFPGWNGKKLKEGDTIVAPIYWAYYLVDEEQDKVNWGIITKTVEVVLIVASAGTLAPEIILIESVMAGADFVINVAADYAPHNSDIRDFQEKFQVLYAVYGVTALANLAISVNWITAIQKGGRILYTFRPNNFVPMLRELKSLSLTKVENLITKLDEAIDALIIAKSNLNMVQGAKVLSFINYLKQCKRLAIFSRYHNANINHGNFYIEGGELFFKFSKTTHGVNKGYTIRISKIWDDVDNGIYLSDLNLYNAVSDGSVVLDDIIELAPIKLQKPNNTFADVEYRVIITSQGKVRMISKASLEGLINASTGLISKIESLQLSVLLAKVNLLDELTKAMFSNHFSSLTNANLTRMNNFPNCVDIWKIHSEAGRLSLAQNFDIWMKHLEARSLLMNANYQQVAAKFNKSLTNGLVVNSSKYVVDGTYNLQALQKADLIAAKTVDVQLIAQNSGFSATVIEKVKQHFYINEHLIPMENGFVLGRFERTAYDNALWEFAESGFTGNFNYIDDLGFPATISAQDGIEDFKRLIFHEYAELELMQYGMSYRGLFWMENPSPYSFGAHDIAPTFNNSIQNLQRMTNSTYPQNFTELEQFLTHLKSCYKL